MRIMLHSWMAPRGFAPGLFAGAVLAAAVFSVATCDRKGGSTAAREGDDIVLGRVAGKEFTVSDLRDKMKYQFRSVGENAPIDQQRQIWLDAMDQLCFVTYGEKNGFTRDEEYKRTLELSRRYILAERTVQREVRDKETPTEEEIRRYYDQNPKEFVVPVRVQLGHVQTRTYAQAEAARRRLENGEPLASVARAMSIDEQTKSGGGVLAWVTATSGIGHLGNAPHVNSSVIGLKKGGISDILQIGDAFSVFVVVDRTEEQVRPYDAAVRDAVAKRVQTKKHNDLYNGLLDRLRKEYDVEFYNENFEKYANSKLDEPALFAAAEREKDAGRRIGYYEEIVRRFPQSARAGQAQFMIGFLLADERKEFGAARKAFESFLEKHPDDELAASARWMLENMENPNPDPVTMQDLRRRVR